MTQEPKKAVPAPTKAELFERNQAIERAQFERAQEREKLASLLPRARGAEHVRVLDAIKAADKYCDHFESKGGASEGFYTQALAFRAEAFAYAERLAADQAQPAGSDGA